MNLSGSAGLFGNRTKTNLLQLLALLERVHVSEAARIIGTTPSNILKAADALTQAGAVASVLTGKERWISLEPRYHAASELRALLDRLAEGNVELMEQVSATRRRPRRGGKAI